MLEFLQKHKRKLALFFSILIIWILFLLNNSNIYFNTLSFFSPVEGIASSFLKGFQDIWNGYIWFVNTERENIFLQKKLEKMKGIESSYNELKAENKRLKGLLSFKESNVIKGSGASVIFRGATSKANTIFLNKGKKDGVMKDMVVISPEGIVGKIVKISKSISMAHLITHPHSAVDAITQRTRERCIFQGGEPCTLKYLDDKADVKQGDLLISSGLGGVFPAGIPLGKIVEVSKQDSGIFLYAEAIPCADLVHLEEVLILENPYHLEIENLKKKANY